MKENMTDANALSLTHILNVCFSQYVSFSWSVFLCLGTSDVPSGFFEFKMVTFKT